MIIELDDSQLDNIHKQIRVDLNELIEEVYVTPFAVDSGLLEIIEYLKVKNNLTFGIKASQVHDNWL